MEISKETKVSLKKDKKRLEAEIKVMASTAKELKDAIKEARREYDEALAGMSEKVATGILIELQLAEAESDTSQVKDGSWNSEGARIRKRWEKLSSV